MASGPAPFAAGDFGTGWVMADGGCAVRIFLPRPEASAPGIGPPDVETRGLARRLEAYFRGEDNLGEFPFRLPDHLGDFTRRVLGLCAAIPLGEVRSYGDLAAAAGNPGAARAVGRAMATNPLPLAIPCHRVLPASGALGHFGGGVAMKQWLLEREAAGRSLFR